MRSKLDQFLDAMKGKGTSVRVKDSKEARSEILTGKDLEAVAGAGRSIKGSGNTVSWSLPFPAPPGPINPWTKAIGDPPPGPTPPPVPPPKIPN